MKKRNLRMLLSAWLATLFVCSAVAQEGGPVVDNGVLRSWTAARGAIKIPDGVTELADNLFRRNGRITSIDFNEVRIVGTGACAQMSSLASFSAPKVEVLGDSAFYKSGSWSSMVFELSFPELHTVGNEAMQWGFFTLRYLSLPKVRTLGRKFLTLYPTSILDLGAASELSTVHPEAFDALRRIPKKEESSGEGLYMAVASEAVRALIPTSFAEKIFLSVLTPTAEPTATLVLKDVRKGSLDRSFPLFGFMTGGKVLAIDVGDGRIRALPVKSRLTSSDFGICYVLYMDAIGRTIEGNVTVKLYDEAEVFSTQRSNISALDLTPLKSGLKWLDVSGNGTEDSPQPRWSDFTALEYLRLSDLPLPTLEVEGLSHLKALNVSRCQQLSELRLPTQLESLSVTNCKQLTTLPWQSLSALRRLNAAYDKLEGTVDLSHCAALETVDLSHNEIATLRLPGGNVLKTFRCGYNQIESIDFADTASEVEYASVSKNRLTSMPLTQLYRRLPDRSQKSEGKIVLLKNISDEEEDNKVSEARLSLLLERNWRPLDENGGEFSGMIVEGDTLVSWNDASGAVVIPETVRVVAPTAFMRNARVTSITGVNVEECYGIRYCSALTELNLPQLRKTRMNRVYQAADGGTHLVETQIGMGSPLRHPVIAHGTLFFYPSGLAQGAVTLGEEVKTIDTYAFYQCTGMTALSGNGVTEMEKKALIQCSALAAVTLPRLEKTRGNLFAESPLLSKVESEKGIWLWRNAPATVQLPATVRYVGDYAFQGNAGLTSVQLPEGVEYIGEYAFASCGLTTFTLPSSVRHLGVKAFADCTSLSGKVVIPEHITELGSAVFSNCTSITEAEVMAPCRLLPPLLFERCSALQKVTLGKGVQAILAGANESHLYSFYRCEQLTTLVLHAPRVVKGYESMKHFATGSYIQNVPLLNTIYVPSALLNAYRETFANLEYIAIDTASDAAQITYATASDYELSVTLDGAAIASGSSHPLGQKFKVRVLTAPGKIVRSLIIDGVAYEDCNVQYFTLCNDTHISAVVEDFTLSSSHEELFRFTPEAIPVGQELGFALTLPSVAPTSWSTMTGHYERGAFRTNYVVDWGGGRYTMINREAALDGFRNEWTHHNFPKLVPGAWAEEGAPVVVYRDRAWDVEANKIVVAGKTPSDHQLPISRLLLTSPLAALQFSSLPYLESLNVGPSQECSLSSIDFSPLPRLESLYLARCSISALSLSNTTLIRLGLTELPQLKDMANVSLPASLRGLSTYNLPLKELDLSGTTLGDREIVIVTGMPLLQRLKASSTPVSYTLEAPAMGVCGWNAFFESLPTVDPALNKVVELNYRGAEALDRIRSAQSAIAIAKGYKVIASERYPGTAREELNNNTMECKDAYALSARITGITEGADILYQENGVEQPLPSSMPYGSTVTLTFRYPESSALKEVKGVTAHLAAQVEQTKEEGKNLYSVTFYVDKEVDIEVVLTAHYRVLREVHGKGTLTLQGASDLLHVEHGTQLTAVAEPEEHYELTALTANGADILPSGTFTVTGATTVKAHFALKKYLVTLQSNGPGTIAVAEKVDLEAVPHGTRLTVVATPLGDNAVLRSLTANGVDILATRQFVVTGATEVEAEFSEKKYPVTLQSNGPGTIAIAETVDFEAVPHGTRLTVVATPMGDNAVLQSLTANGVDILATRQFVVTGATKVEAEFSEKTATESVPDTPIRIYPNPVDTHLWIEGVPAGSLVELFDMKGARWAQFTAPEGEPLRIDTSGWLPGHYLLKVGEILHKVEVAR